MKALQPQKADGNEKLNVERIENDFYITADHAMEREHYIVFVALLTGDSILIKRQYPEWGLRCVFLFLVMEDYFGTVTSTDYLYGTISMGIRTDRLVIMKH